MTVGELFKFVHPKLRVNSDLQPQSISGLRRKSHGDPALMPIGNVSFQHQDFIVIRTNPA